MLIAPCTSLVDMSALARQFSNVLLLLRDHFKGEIRVIKIGGFPVGVFKARLIGLKLMLAAHIFSCSPKDVMKACYFLTRRIEVYSVRLIQPLLVIIFSVNFMRFTISFVSKMLHMRLFIAFVVIILFGIG